MLFNISLNSLISNMNRVRVQIMYKDQYDQKQQQGKCAQFYTSDPFFIVCCVCFILAVALVSIFGLIAILF